MSLLNNLKDCYGNYKEWIKSNPRRAQEAETTFKWVSYFLSGRVNSSAIPTEVAYTVSNLIVLLNDRIINESTVASGAPGDKVRLILTILEYCEVILELSAKRLWGEKVKWITIATTQCAKALMRLSLLMDHNQLYIPSPAIIPLNREIALRTCNGDVAESYLAFELKSCKRVIRKVDASPKSTKSRSWVPVTPSQARDASDRQHQIEGELLHILRPIFHLLVTYKCGEKSWKPWWISLTIDLVSLEFLGRGMNRQTSINERNERSKRMLMLVLYVLRSPFYERYSENRLTSFLNALSRVVPLARFFCEPTKTYIPFFQSTYSYVWST